MSEGLSEWGQRYEALLQERLQEEQGPCVLTAWIAISECVDVDGNHWLVCYRHPRTPIWTRMGMLEFALDEERRMLRED
ncbi:MAG TPA: hypothetical protein VNO79_10700 [Actinomycetota bacterium]|nr:hypothetical protein [Actinomycetota bacterium]